MVHTGHMTTSPRGRETSKALTEIRAARGRAIAARSSILAWPEVEPGKWVPDGPERLGPRDRPYQPLKFVATGPAEYDRDKDEMIATLDAFIAATAQWERTGPTPRKKD